VNLRYSTIHTSTGATQREFLAVPLSILADLIRYRPDVIVSGDLGLRSFVCWCAARLLGARFVLWSEDIASSAAGRSRLQQRLRRFLVGRADAFLAWGTPAQGYLSSLNVPRRKIFTCAQAIDNDYWVRKARALDRHEERQALGFKGVVFLLVGRALRLKGFQNFLHAWGALPEDLHARASAVVVGEGEYLPALQDLAGSLGLKNVTFAGAKSPDELARYYAASDIFVFPSLVDVWGLVVNEALCFGLPVLASRHAGASQALIAGSDVGVMFDPLDVEQFAARLGAWIENPPERAPAACRQALKDVTFAASSAAIQKMLDGVMSAEVPHGQ
jgi:glycosyltransferase involved in cell wall biosynthesis